MTNRAGAACSRKWLAFELHTHTVHSDGRHTLRELAQSAAALGLDGIALTDHNTTSGLYGKEEIEAATGIRIWNGLEWTTFYGHMLVLGLDAGAYADWRMLGPNELSKGLQEVKALGALAGIAHPFRVGSPMCTGCYWEYTIDRWEDIDFIEVWSGTFPSVKTDNHRAFALWTEMLNRGFRLTATCGRDWHDSTPGEAEKERIAVTYIGHESPTEAIAKGAVVVSMGPLLDMEAAGDDFTVGIGGEAAVGGESRSIEVSVRVDFERRKSVWTLPEQQLEIKLVGNRGVEAVVPLPVGASTASAVIEAAGLIWLRAELYGTLNHVRTMIAFTNAIYFRSAQGGHDK
jgi:hypothetical protein